MKLKETLRPVATWAFWKELIVLTLAMTIAAAAVYYFLVPSNLIMGSVAGLAMVIAEVSKMLFGGTLSISMLILILNIILLGFAYAFIGKEFGLKTVYASLILGPLMSLFENYLPYQMFLDEGAKTLMNDPWLDLLTFVIVVSASQAILFHHNASTGGLDIVGKIINKYMHMDIGTSVSIAGFVICCMAFFINPFGLVTLGLIGTWINGLVIDYFTSGMNRKKRVHIITDEYKQIQEFIIHKLHRGCTLYEVIGGYSGEKKIQLEALLSIEEFGKLMEFVKTNKFDAFISADSVTEVYGLWATKRRQMELTMEAQQNVDAQK